MYVCLFVRDLVTLGAPINHLSQRSSLSVSSRSPVQLNLYLLYLPRSIQDPNPVPFYEKPKTLANARFVRRHEAPAYFKQGSNIASQCRFALARRRYWFSTGINSTFILLHSPNIETFKMQSLWRSPTVITSRSLLNHEVMSHSTRDLIKRELATSARAVSQTIAVTEILIFQQRPTVRATAQASRLDTKRSSLTQGPRSSYLGSSQNKPSNELFTKTVRVPPEAQDLVVNIPVRLEREKQGTVGTVASWVYRAISLVALGAVAYALISGSRVRLD